MLLKGLIFRGNALIYIKEPYVLFFLIAGLLSHHCALFPRYLYHVLKNSVAPSPITHARHLDRMAPSTRSQWIKEWRSLRGGGHVKSSDLSTPPSPTLETPVDFYPQSSVSAIGDVDLNVISENYLRARQSWPTKTCLHHDGLFILEFVHTTSFLSRGMGGILYKRNQRETLFLTDLWQIIYRSDEFIMQYSSWQMYAGPVLLALLITWCHTEHISLLLSWWVFSAQF